ncbi:GNAT family N-acetyltransferase [Clostridium tagluense]|uniref:GNAT family N-acetyltransferase n=1 Tax=Clostridium tagluense TaxID=360422 RepID=UPI001CF452F8|nr:GNAT family N-acetyltransferase [Clostridium tagluense]MCB2311906.1 GNAT family N-acetyltransferase [Clostridium tagluense]MCB2317341.1 GNAT family N-acetyltransferase [Clostridium tagluense]MCB2322869.1 GNAT family N-acetyltransferase [Clostridium tagluense]MCB2326895.1 GNAT family N-acetyltransferase [Clostridium tagluense]MCB2332508.1 GNAT family N-acetyltransferase [Clostridium tagluense]
MIGTPIIRKCDAEDESSFVKLNLHFMQEVMAENPYWTSLKIPTEKEMKSMFREALIMPEHILIFVVEVDGEVIGYANTWTAYSIWSRGKALTIDDLYIFSHYRRSGIGEELMKYLIEFAKQNGYKRVQLHAELNNERAHSLYRKLGFSEEEIIFFMKQVEF